jgi:hypothetical protein
MDRRNRNRKDMQTGDAIGTVSELKLRTMPSSRAEHLFRGCRGVSVSLLAPASSSLTSWRIGTSRCSVGCGFLADVPRNEALNSRLPGRSSLLHMHPALPQLGALRDLGRPRRVSIAQRGDRSSTT